MPRLAKELTPIEIKRLTMPGYHAVGHVPGLMLQVSPSGTTSWLLRVKVGDKRREIGLGAYPGVGLALAHQKAQQVRDDIVAGVDPVAKRAENRQAIVEQQAEEKRTAWTFRRCAEAYIKATAPSWRNKKHAKQWTSTLEAYAYPTIGDLMVRSVTKEHIIHIIEPHWATKNETINRVRNRIETVLDWAKQRNLRTGDNPARWQGNLDKAGFPDKASIAPVQKHRALDASQMYDFLGRLRGGGGMGARALEFVVLTACRSGEARMATWSEIDWTAKTWRIPASRTKSAKRFAANGIETFNVPLSDDVIKLLQALPRFERVEWIFPGAKAGSPLSDMTLTKVLRDMAVNAVPHGFRATFSSWTASSTGYPSEVREMALAHAIGDGTVAAYQRSDLFEKRRNLMADWAKFINTAPVAADNDVPIRGAA
jgi:integrase